MIILGIDPGIARLGWGIISEERGKLTMIDYGCFETPATEAEPNRLREIFEFLTELIKTHKPEVLSIEELFFAANARTALTVGQARGVAIVAASLLEIPSYSYTPLQIKQALSGYGRADKAQIQFMVKSILKLGKIPQPDDAADALAVAITHAFSYKLAEKRKIL